MLNKGEYVTMKYFFTDSQIEQIREGAAAILNEIGVKVGRSELVEQLSLKGFRIDGNFVRIDKETSIKKIDSQKPEAVSGPVSSRPRFSTWISSYSHTFETVDGEFEPITVESNLRMGEFVVNLGKMRPGLVNSCPGHPTDIPPEAYGQQLLTL